MSDEDFAIEPIQGLPEELPEGEEILWQGRPHAWALARDSLNMYWVMGWFVVLGIWRVIALSDLVPLSQALFAGSMFLVIGLVACSILWLIAFIQARLSVYTITTSRVAMRIGAALTLNLNIPFSKVANASLHLRRDGSGTIALEPMPGQLRLSFLMLWPHARPWSSMTQPAMRSIPNAQAVARILADAADTRVSEPVISRGVDPVPAE
ncbi:MAG: PH domain-containing protein [Marinovum sp.]|nr:PH domain-containing protein [Marinovum sp.]